MIVRRERLKRTPVSQTVDQPALRIEILHGGQLFDVVTLDAKPGEPDPRPQWIADYNQMMQPLGMTARLPQR